MHFKHISILTALFATGNSLVGAIPQRDGGQKGQNNNKSAKADAAKTSSGNENVDPTAAFCKSVKLAPTDGKQIKAGSCSTTVQGAIPSFDKMVSTLIVAPDSGAQLDASVDNKITIDFQNLEAGFFSDAETQYYAGPQQLNGQGVIQGHQHVTVQALGNGKAALDARQFDFFKGLNDPAADGTLSVTMPAGSLLKNGVHRICSITGTFNHQPVIMPVAQRGSQDDCIRVNVTNAGKVPPPAKADAAKKGLKQGKGNDKQAKADKNQAKGNNKQAKGNNKQAKGDNKQAKGNNKQANNKQAKDNNKKNQAQGNKKDNKQAKGNKDQKQQ